MHLYTTLVAPPATTWRSKTATMAVPPQAVTEAASRDDTGLFFKRLGEICFSPASEQAYEGWASAVAVAPRAGLVFFSDSRGETSSQWMDSR